MMQIHHAPNGPAHTRPKVCRVEERQASSGLSHSVAAGFRVGPGKRILVARTRAGSSTTSIDAVEFRDDDARLTTLNDRAAIEAFEAIGL